MATSTGLLGIESNDFNPFIGLDPVETLSYKLRFGSNAVGSASLESFVEGANSETGPFFYQGNFINTSNPLSFVWYRENGLNGAVEEFQLNSISISIKEKELISEPHSILSLLIFGVWSIGSAIVKAKSTLSD